MRSVSAGSDGKEKNRLPEPLLAGTRQERREKIFETVSGLLRELRCSAIGLTKYDLAYKVQFELICSVTGYKCKAAFPFGLRFTAW